MIVILTLTLLIVVLLAPAIITGEWHSDRMDVIERGELF